MKDRAMKMPPIDSFGRDLIKFMIFKCIFILVYELYIFKVGNRVFFKNSQSERYFKKSISISLLGTQGFVAPTDIDLGAGIQWVPEEEVVSICFIFFTFLILFFESATYCSL